MMDKKNLLVSFSGGETSAYMAQYLWKHFKHKFNMVFVFANTGQENEETLEFVKKCSKLFGFRVHWIEAVPHYGKRKACTHDQISFETASRNGEPFEAVIKKYGIPNKAYPHCTRELKLNPIKSFAKEYFGIEPYASAVGIRVDEIDRVNAKAKELNLIYPLADSRYQPMTKAKINFWWSLQPFRLDLKGYQGNCKTCWKKSNNKLYKLAKENPKQFEFMKRMEAKYPRVGAEFLKNPDSEDRVFFRGKKSTIDILREAEAFDGSIKDDSDVYDETESCEVWSSCGD